MKNIQSLIASIAILGVVGLAVGTGAGAAEVTATVTPQIVSVTVTNGSVNYGILDAGDSNNTFDGAATADTQIIENTGNVSTDVLIRSSDAIGDTLDWNLAATASTDVFVHSYDIDASVPSWTVFPADNGNTSSVVTLASSGTTATMDLKIDMPSSITDTSDHSITVTVVAIATP